MELVERETSTEYSGDDFEDDDVEELVESESLVSFHVAGTKECAVSKGPGKARTPRSNQDGEAIPEDTPYSLASCLNGASPVLPLAKVGLPGQASFDFSAVTAGGTGLRGGDKGHDACLLSSPAERERERGKEGEREVARNGGLHYSEAKQTMIRQDVAVGGAKPNTRPPPQRSPGRGSLVGMMDYEMALSPDKAATAERQASNLAGVSAPSPPRAPDDAETAVGEWPGRHSLSATSAPKGPDAHRVSSSVTKARKEKNERKEWCNRHHVGNALDEPIKKLPARAVKFETMSGAKVRSTIDTGRRPSASRKLRRSKSKPERSINEILDTKEARGVSVLPEVLSPRRRSSGLFAQNGQSSRPASVNARLRQSRYQPLLNGSYPTRRPKSSGRLMSTSTLLPPLEGKASLEDQKSSPLSRERRVSMLFRDSQINSRRKIDRGENDIEETATLIQGEVSVVLMPTLGAVRTRKEIMQEKLTELEGKGATKGSSANSDPDQDGQSKSRARSTRRKSRTQVKGSESSSDGKDLVPPSSKDKHNITAMERRRSSKESSTRPPGKKKTEEETVQTLARRHHMRKLRMITKAPSMSAIESRERRKSRPSASGLTNVAENAKSSIENKSDVTNQQLSQDKRLSMPNIRQGGQRQSAKILIPECSVSNMALREEDESEANEEEYEDANPARLTDKASLQSQGEVISQSKTTGPAHAPISVSLTLSEGIKSNQNSVVLTAADESTNVEKNRISSHAPAPTPIAQSGADCSSPAAQKLQNGDVSRSNPSTPCDRNFSCKGEGESTVDHDSPEAANSKPRRASRSPTALKDMIQRSRQESYFNIRDFVDTVVETPRLDPKELEEELKDEALVRAKKVEGRRKMCAKSAAFSPNLRLELDLSALSGDESESDGSMDESDDAQSFLNNDANCPNGAERETNPVNPAQKRRHRKGHRKANSVDRDGMDDRNDTSYDFTESGTITIADFQIKSSGIAKSPKRKHSQTLNVRRNLVQLGILGRGASGIVRKGLHLPSMLLVAVKSIPVYDPEKRHQMVAELQALYENLVPLSDENLSVPSSSLCPQIVNFYDAYINPEEGNISIIVEYMDGGSLQDLVLTGGCTNERVLANIAYQLLKGLAFIHARHSLHRDIKPGNLLIDRKGKVKLSDFGIVRDLGNSMANAHTFVGTMTYMSPERIAGEDYSYSSDVWSLGLSILACALGKFPLPTSGGYWGLLQLLREETPIPLPRDRFSPAFCDFVQECLHKDKIKRPTAQKLLEHHFFHEYMDDLLQSTGEVQPAESLTPREALNEDSARSEVVEIISHLKLYHIRESEKMAESRKDDWRVTVKTEIEREVRHSPALADQIGVDKSFVEEQLQKMRESVLEEADRIYARTAQNRQS